MIREKRVAAAVAVLLLMSATSALASTDVSVNIVDAPRPQPKWGYAPGTRRIEPGSWVTWSNNGLDAHTVTAIDGTFDSENLDPSQGFSWFFDQPGTFPYECTLHPWMKGRIVVSGQWSVVSDPPLADSDQPAADQPPPDSVPAGN
jgi:plastocyanin